MASQETTSPRCAHCQREVLGFAAMGDDTLCHPDYGIDCYRLVTVYRHTMPCSACRDARLLLDRMNPRLAALR